MDTLNGKIIRDDLLTSKINSVLQEGPVVYLNNIKKLLLTRSIERVDSDKKYQLNINLVDYPLSENKILKGANF